MVQISEEKAKKWNVNVRIHNKFGQLLYKNINLNNIPEYGFLILTTDTYWVSEAIYYQHTCKLKDIL